MAESKGREAWVTLATNDIYARSALVLSASLVEVGTTRQKVILITSGVSDTLQALVRSSFDEVVLVNVIDSKSEKILSAMKRPELGVTLTKLHCWSLTQFDKCVFLDADTMLIQNADELFEREELSAAPDIGWPDCFNSGVFVFVPSSETLTALMEQLAAEGSFDGGDQGLLNSFFSNWFTSDSSKHLSFIYNMTLVGAYSFLPAYEKFGKNVKIVHFLGSSKPWHCPLDTRTGSVTVPRGRGSEQQVQHVQRWWNLFLDKVQPQLTATMMTTAPDAGIESQMANLSVFETVLPAIIVQNEDAIDMRDKRRQWEAGLADYMGADSFESIQKKLDQNISK